MGHNFDASFFKFAQGIGPAVDRIHASRAFLYNTSGKAAVGGIKGRLPDAVIACKTNDEQMGYPLRAQTLDRIMADGTRVAVSIPTDIGEDGQHLSVLGCPLLHEEVDFVHRQALHNLGTRLALDTMRRPQSHLD